MPNDTTTTSASRPSKKQKVLLSFIDTFIAGYGYGPSYREIMRALDYKSVSTVAVHVDSLIAKGLLVKRDKSARSLVVVSPSEKPNKSSSEKEHVRWLEARLRHVLATELPDNDRKAAHDFLRVLGLDESIKLEQ